MGLGISSSQVHPLRDYLVMLKDSASPVCLCLYVTVASTSPRFKYCAPALYLPRTLCRRKG